MKENIIKSDIKIKKLSNKEINILNELCENLPGEILQEKLYLFWFNFKKPECGNPNCDNYCNFYGFNKGYSKTCCMSCAQKNPKTRQKIENTNLDRYGSKTYTGTEGYKQSLLDNYGYENPFQSEKIKEKIKKTNIERYGAENPNKNKDIRQKIENTNMKKYGVKHGLQADSVKEKIKQTTIEKYGVDHYSKTTKFKKAIKNTCLKRYGVDNPLKSEIIKEKIKQTMLRKYGVEYALQNQDLYEKALSSSKAKYAIKWYKTKFGYSIKYQSIPELNLIKFMELNNIYIKNGPTIKYKYLSKIKYYHVDFETDKYLIEIKGNHGWYRQDLKSGKIAAKNVAAEKYCKENNKDFKFIIVDNNYDYDYSSTFG